MLTALDSRYASSLDMEATCRALHLTACRVEWLTKMVAQDATEEELNELERLELSSMLETATASSPSTAAAARRTLDALGLSAPDFIPPEMADAGRG
jgi:hypothetical protein